MATEIRVTASDGKIVHLDIEGDQPITANYQFKDIQDVGATKGSHTYNFRIPSSRKNNRFFSFYYNVTQFGNFNPNKKSKCAIIKNDLSVFDGYLQLTNVVRSKSGISSYECVVFSGVASLGQVLKGKYLSEFDWSSYTHTKTLSNVTGSWSNLLHGGDIVYSLFDYGQAPMYGGDLDGSFQNEETPINVNNLFPQIKVKAMLDKILNQSGFEYESDFFGSTGNGGKLFVDINNGGASATASNDDYYKFRGQGDGTQTIYEIKNEALGLVDTSSVNYANDSGIYNNISRDFTIPSGVAFTSGKFGAWVHFKTSESNNINEVAPYTGCQFSLALVTGALGYYTTIAESRMFDCNAFRGQAGNTGKIFQDKIKLEPVVTNVQAGQKFQLQFKIYGDGFQPSGLTRSITLIESSFSFTPMIGFYGNRFEEYNATAEVQLKYMFPKIKAVDFISSLAKKFNLVIVPDKITPNKLTIEPYVYWIGQGNDLNWTSKLDQSKDIQFKPTSELQAKSLTFTDAESSDNMNALFRKSMGRNYGAYILDNSENDFGKETEEIKTIFKPLITTYIPYTTIMSCICYEGEGSNKTNPEALRLSFFNGITRPFNRADTFWVTDGFPNTTPVEHDQYPSFTNYNSTDIYQQTHCLTFLGENTGALERPVSWNNAFNVYWRPFINETYSRNARLLTGHFNLSSVDIATLNMNDIIRVEQSFYRINKISNYSLVGQSTCKVELIKTEATKVIDANGDECNVEPFEFKQNGSVLFKNRSTGVIEAPTQECCEAYGYEYDTINSTCYSRTLTPINISSPSISQFHSSDINVGSSFGAIYTSINGEGNQGSEFTLINGSDNEVKPMPKKLIVNGGKNKVSGNVKTAKIDGDGNTIDPPSLTLSRFNPNTTTTQYISFQQRFRNVKLQGDFGFPIASNSEFKSSTQKTGDTLTTAPSVQQVTGTGTINASASVTGQTHEYVGADGQFDGTQTDAVSPDEVQLINEQGANFIQLPYPSFMSGEIQLTGSPESTTSADQFAEETFEFEINNQGTSLQPTATITNVSGKSRSTSDFNNLDLDIVTATPSTYYDATEEKYINDGMFAFKVDQSTMPNIGKVNYNLKMDYRLIHSKNRSRIPFNPTAMTSADCVLWLDPNDISTINFSGGNVSQISDKANFFIPTPIYYTSAGGNSTLPTYVSPSWTQKNGLYFNGSTDMLRNTEFSLYRIPYFENSTIFVVYRASTSTASTYGGTAFGTAYFNGNPNFGIIANATNNGSLGSLSTTFINGGFGTNSWNASLNNVGSNQLQVVIGEHYGTTQFIEDQQGNTASNNLAGSPFATHSGLGGLINSSGNVISPLEGYVFEVIWFQGNLNTAEKTEVKNYLLNKWIK